MTLLHEPAAQREPRQSPGAVRRKLYPAVWWVPLLMIVATEYKFRRRTNADSLSGSLDVWTAVELGVYAIIGAYLLIRWKPRLRQHLVVVFLVGYCLSTAASAVYAPFPLLALARAIQLVIVLLTIMQWLEAADLDMVRKFLHGYVVLISVSIVVGIAYVAPTTTRQVGRFTWLFTHSVIAGLMLAISCAVLFAMWLTHRVAQLPWARWIYGALLVFNLVALVRTRTRGSIGAGLVAMVVMAIMCADNRRRRDLMVISVVGITALALSVGGPILLYLNRGEDAAQVETFNRRTEIWSLAWKTFLGRPLHGLGFTASRGVFFDATGLGGAHNAFVNVVVDVGLVGLFWWFGLLGLIMVGVSRIRRGIGRNDTPQQFDVIAIYGVMIAEFVNGITTESLGSGVSIGSIFLYITAAWVVVLDDATTSGLRSWFTRRRRQASFQIDGIAGPGD